MNNRTHLTIVCLKNDRPHQPFHQRSGVILPMLNASSSSLISQQEHAVPSLAYLSARLQFNQHEQVHSALQHRNKLGSQMTLEMTETQSLRAGEDIQPTIEQYVQDQKNSVDNKKNTIRNMMGSIDFALDRKKQRKVARTIQQTIVRFNGTERVRTTNKKGNRSILEDHTMQEVVHSDRKQKQKRRQRQKRKELRELITRQPCSPQNRTVLAQDFNVFLTNQKKRLQSLPKVDQSQAIKLRRLAVVNPQEISQNPNKESERLDLFRFQLRNPSSIDRHQYNSTSANFANSHAAIARARLEKKMFKMALNMDDEEFDWTRVPSKQGFKLKGLC